MNCILLFLVSGHNSQGYYLPWLILILVILLFILLSYKQSRKLKRQKQVINELEQQTTHIEELQNRSQELDDLLVKYETQKKELDKALAKLEEWDKLVPELQEIARFDHDVNTPLCIVTLSLGRAQKVGKEQNDEALLTMVDDIFEAVNRIGEIMQKVAVLKKSPLISYKSGGQELSEERGTV